VDELPLGEQLLALAVENNGHRLLELAHSIVPRSASGDITLLQARPEHDNIKYGPALSPPYASARGKYLFCMGARRRYNSFI
ncbi:MAG TPA: hypothetical protein P5202_00820, partial [Methanomassiliicoccales archaeon]|nr:hypothetical protein [Methanomassiliicoccales archaeon]